MNKNSKPNTHQNKSAREKLDQFYKICKVAVFILQLLLFLNKIIYINSAFSYELVFLTLYVFVYTILFAIYWKIKILLNTNDPKINTMVSLIVSLIALLTPMILPTNVSQELSSFISISCLLVSFEINMYQVGYQKWLISSFLNICRLIVILLSLLDTYEGTALLKSNALLTESIIVSIILDGIIRELIIKRKNTVTIDDLSSKK